MREVFRKFYGEFFGARNLYLGCGMDQEPSGSKEVWVNLDFNPKVCPDICHDLNNVPLPFPDNEFNCVFSCHCLEHLEKIKFVEVIAEIHRILVPRGILVAITPYGSADVALGMPQHKQAFYEITWTSIDKRLYENKDQFGFQDDEGLPFRTWDTEKIVMIPFLEWEKDPALTWKAKHLRNVISDLHAVMRAVKE